MVRPRRRLVFEGLPKHQEEFYDVVEIPLLLAEHRGLLRTWEETYNSIRPHQALGYLTPNEFLRSRGREKEGHR